ncbi:MAG TPA: hypothetical protein VFQ51_05495 [Vicinamibacteria bacterium]|nr:hypothetical protein [Vicinamibacteria bacterium]
MNAFGVNVEGLDVAVFLAQARLVAALGSLAWVALVLRWRRPSVVLGGVLAANAFVWLVTSWPLQRIYALGPSADRMTNVAWCTVVAAGGSPLETAQVGQLHFEPLWGVLVASLSGFDPDRVLALDPFLSLAVALLFPAALYAGLKPAEEGAAWSTWERAAAAMAGSLLLAAPLDYVSTYGVPWSLMFLLKPNHALALVLFPLFLRAFVRLRGWGSRVLVGLLLHVLAWAFVLHMAYVAVGLAVYAAWSWLTRQPDARRVLADVATVLGVNVLIVSPYLVMLFVGYPFLTPLPIHQIVPTSPHLLEMTFRLGPLFPLGAWGVVVAYRRGDRLGRVWSAQVAGAYLIWLAYLVLSAMHEARERDEIAFWIRMLMATSAGIGAWDLCSRLAARWQGTRATPARRAAALMVVALPWCLPCWWQPDRMDRYFTASLAPLPRRIAEPALYLRRHAEPGAVVASDPDYSRWLSALGARRVLRDGHMHLTSYQPERDRVLYTLLRDGDAARVAAAAERFQIRYLVVTPALLAAHPGVTLEDLASRAHWDPVAMTEEDDGDPVVVFRLLREPGPGTRG